MDVRIRRLGIAFVLLFAAAVRADRLRPGDRRRPDRERTGQRARQIRAEYKTDRGRFLAPDGITVLAESVEAPEGSVYRFERRYPEGDLYGHITGYYSRVYKRSGLEDAMNPYLSGDADELAIANLTDLILGKPKQGGTVITTIVPELQEAARRALGSQRGAVAAIDPATGDVLALWSNPSFDPTPLSVGTGEEMREAWEELNADAESRSCPRRSRSCTCPGRRASS